MYNLQEGMSDSADTRHPTPTIRNSSLSERSRRPVFVVGCHRSGTNLLYDTLLSAGGFAVYRGYLPIHKILIPRFGHPSDFASRKKIVDAFMLSKGFARTELNAQDLSSKLLSGGHTGGDFIRIIMGEITHRQGASRWAVYDPDGALHINRIKADIPDALFVHIIRDGRDVALSLMKMGEFRPFPWSRKPRGLLETALYWEWVVRAGRRHGQQIPDDYTEIHYEDLVRQPRPTLATLARFLDHDLNYDQIQKTGLGRLRESNSSFLNDPGDVQQLHPVNRWRERLSPEQVKQLEALVGSTLEKCGYQLLTPSDHLRLDWRWRCLGAAYPRFLDAKLWLKLNTPVGRFANLSALELSPPGFDIH
jgi:LPS sulfotransferase NodH